MAALRAVRPTAIARPGLVAQRAVAAPRFARMYASSPKPEPSGPTPGASPDHGPSRVTGTYQMLGWSAAGLAAASIAFLLLNRETKKSVIGVGPDADNKLKGSKAKVAGTNGASAAVAAGISEPASKADYQQVYNAIAARLEEDPDYDDGNYGPVLVRLAWHASGTYCKDTKTGGSNGATMRFAPEANHGANAGLLAARNFLEPIKKQFEWISYSDLWTLAGVCAIQELGGPKVPWRPGRSDREAEHCTPDGRLPDGDKDQDHLRKIFYRQGFNDQEIVALSGAHALGRCHPDRSGFVGPWQHSPTSFNNEYFRLLFNEKWQFKKHDGPIQYEDLSTKALMMLTTDMALVKDKSFRKYAKQYADSEDKFFEDFSKVFAKLLENGVPAENFAKAAWSQGKPFTLQTSHELEDAK